MQNPSETLPSNASPSPTPPPTDHASTSHAESQGLSRAPPRLSPTSSRHRVETGGREGESRGNNRICPTYHQFLPAQFLPPIFPRKGIRSAAFAIESREGLRGKWTRSEGKGGRKQGISANSREIADPLERRSHSTRSDSLLRVVSLCVMGFAAPRLIRALSRTNSDTSQEGICQLRIRGVKQEDPRSSSRLYKLRIPPFG